MNIRDEILKNFNNGFIKHNGIKVNKLDFREAIVEYDVKESGLNPYNMVHGGMILSLADTACGILSCMSGRASVTTSSTINYINAAKCKKLYAKAKVLKEGKKIGYYEASVYDENNTLIASVFCNMFFINQDK